MTETKTHGENRVAQDARDRAEYRAAVSADKASRERFEKALHFLYQRGYNPEAMQEWPRVLADFAEASERDTQERCAQIAESMIGATRHEIAAAIRREGSR